MSEFDNATAAPLPPAGSPNAEERQWGLFAHLSALAGLVIPLGNVLGPLIIWQIKKDTLPFAADQAKEALNFNITMAIAAVIGFVLILVLIGMVLLPVIGLIWIVFTVLAAIKANNGEAYRYPFTLRLVS
ncbi:MAG TPA: DUF4870 domain-containing protein [Pseudoxanthomonas sp.]|nr:DUF4870 domain-containing protein [Pseudoxanthomonas sp.]